MHEIEIVTRIASAAVSRVPAVPPVLARMHRRWQGKLYVAVM